MSVDINPDRPDESLIAALGSAENIVALCGAGLSAESGIPTFREAQTGLWARHDPMTLASPEGFVRNPALVWEWYQWRRSRVEEAEPNAGHYALHQLAQRRPSTRLITQNVDGLQQRAGAEEVLELHGNLTRNVCSRTGRIIADDWIAEHTDETPPPSPYHPEGLARPGVVWFGEALDERVLGQAIDAAQHCDLMLIVGTSGLVHPAASLPTVARDCGAALLEVNPERTALSASCRWRWPQPSAAALPALLALL
jgi:NAD-dependent deacetylase